MADVPRLLRIPHRLDAAGALHTALKLDLQEVVVLSPGADGRLIWLANDGMTMERANWLMDQFKYFLMTAREWDDGR